MARCAAALHRFAERNNHPELRANATGGDIHASIALPILEQGQAIGVFVAYASEIGFFDEALINLLREMMDDISFGLDALIS
ncbi:MAG: GAF domain-containing protein [Gammaproteobacteria bacterium]|nr:GAF domain-containing protein [Gammaproteobacteria bacterium]